MKSNAASSTITIVYLLKYLVVICVLFIRLSYTSYKNRVEIRYIAAVAKRPNPQNTLQKSEGERQETRTHHTAHTAAAEQQRTDAGQGAAETHADATATFAVDSTREDYRIPRRQAHSRLLAFGSLSSAAVVLRGASPGILQSTCCLRLEARSTQQHRHMADFGSNGEREGERDNSCECASTHCSYSQ